MNVEFDGKRPASLLAVLALALSVLVCAPAAAKPNTHAPAISTWDPRASSIVLGLGSAVSGSGDFSFTSYNANFSSTNGVLSAQFGVHYVTFRDGDDAPLARGVSAGGVALFSLPLASRYENGVPRTSFAFYIGGVPTAMFSGELNFISVPLVLGVGLPLSPSPFITLRPWVELSPGLNFDTRIDAISTQSAIDAAMDGTLTRDEVEDLVEEGLNIERATTVGKRAGLSLAVHLGERVDFDGNLMLGAGHAGALSLAAALVFRWDAMVHELDRSRPPAAESCEEIAARYHRQCPLRRDGRAAPHRGDARDPRQRRAPSRLGAPRSRDPRRQPAPLPAPAAPPPPAGFPPAAGEGPRGAPAPAAAPAPAPAAGSTSGSTTKRPAPGAAPAPPGAPSPAPATRPAPGELPPLQAAPPRTP